MCQIFNKKMATFFFENSECSQKISNLQKILHHNFIVIYYQLNTIYINKI